MKRSKNVILNLIHFWLHLKPFSNSYNICHNSQLFPLAVGRRTCNDEEMNCVVGRVLVAVTTGLRQASNHTGYC